MMTNQHKTVLYIGVTSNLKARVWEHAHHAVPGSFTDRYKVTFLIYYEWFDTIDSAIEREKQLKCWSRKKKEFLIRLKNPEWRFLNEDVYDEMYSLLY
ncbi:GIY-YIG nuclease family protein [Niabella sp. CC-SYL272]|uniref:GIY-YIG nuclease family protein n=1 Tax=Niabella agricola TaxID=2891571 RepID=UPI001F16E0E4|nr:GIY-YIG nuclease family protein [Niabella agricola]MCF3110930.1 GIY-YIG nuclease family protein [Niabella agricola]